MLGTFAVRDDDEAPVLLDRFHAAGGRALDLANAYGEGEATRAVGRWLAARGPATDLTLYVKGCHPPLCRPDLVGPEVERALTLLGLERLDVFMLHRDDLAFPVHAWAQALQAEVAAGRIDGFGVSNWTLARTRELREALGEAGGRLVAFSNQFSLADMVQPPWPGCLAVSRSELADLAALKLRILAWSSLAIGYFAGGESASWSSPANAQRRERARALATRHATTPTAVALAYVLSRGEHVLAVVRTRSEDHLNELMAAAELALCAEELEWLEGERG